MTDRLTQLQEAVNCQAENLCNAIGILQQYAPPSPFPEFERPAPDNAEKQQQPTEDYPRMFAQCIVRTAKDIDVLIDSLPSEDSTPELQAACLRRLELDNQEAAAKLEDAVKRCEKLLEKVQGILRNVARAQLAASLPKTD
jgi:mediator of RNA polymerase II transcription subunit 21